MKDLALLGGTILARPHSEPLPNATVILSNGKIAAIGGNDLPIPAGAQTLDCSGLTIAAGFWNCHVHFFERKWANAASIPAPELERQLQEMSTRHGFTTVFDLSSPWENTRIIRDRIESGEVLGPRILSTGLGLLPSDPGLPPDPVLNFMGLMKLPSPEVNDPTSAANAAKERLETGVDALKLFVSAPSKSTMSEQTVRAAVDEARKFGKQVFVHPNTADDIQASVNAGVDIIAHTTPRTGPWTPDLIAAMNERRIALTPTLTLWKYFLRHDKVSVQDQVVNVALGQLRSWVESGGEVLFGTDLGAVEYDPTDEYLLMSAAGMTTAQILASVTTAPTQRFDSARQTGQIAIGYDADLVILEGDPNRRIPALANPRYTIRAGRIVYRAGP